MGAKKRREEDYVRCCGTCEHSKFAGDDEYPDTVICMRGGKEKEKEIDAVCRRYSYDLLKRTPFRAVDIPTLAPEAFSLD